MSSKRNPVNLYLTSMAPPLWAQFYSWYDTRDTEKGHWPTMVPNHGVWVVREGPKELKVNGIPLPEFTPELIAGCAIFPTDGPYACVEWVNTNPHVSARLRKAAMEKVCWGVRNYGAMNGKKMVCYPMHKGIIRMMEKIGFCHVKETVKTMYSPPYVPVGVYEERLGAAPALPEAAE